MTFSQHCVAANSFVQAFAVNGTGDIPPHNAFNLLVIAAGLGRAESQSHLVDALSAEMRLLPLPSEVKQSLRLDSDPKLCGPGLRDNLKVAFFSLTNPDKPDEYHVAALVKRVKDQKPVAVCEALPVNLVDGHGFMAYMHKKFVSARPE